ncbi:MAG TPA: hypothetical protein PJ997_01345 [Candidatus Paceibacterota bacterium]|nr:hypothetical protein [Candidatus Paceibacterota bacterium]HMP18965.1 hypothetical protein [Candidatus Paceibacterota bacterium]HMP85478.1 hypothetical protein [Candidatus Paceibacterota bacterium]
MAKKQNKKIEWMTFDHIKEEKTTDWFWMVGTIAVGLSILAIFYNNYLFALMILIATFTSFLSAQTPPKIIPFEISRRGIFVNKTLYPFSEIESFCLIDEDGFERDRILIKSQRMFMPIITIPIGEDADMEEIREFLLEFIKEENLTDPIPEVVMRKLGF